MPVRDIIIAPAAILNQPAERVAEMQDVTELARDLWDTLRHHPHGVGLAAPQIGVSLRVAVIDCYGIRAVLVNPKIEREKGYRSDDEYCLSLPGERYRVARATTIWVAGRGYYGKLKDLAARAVQHEIDHLDGILISARGETWPPPQAMTNQNSRRR